MIARIWYSTSFTGFLPPLTSFYSNTVFMFWPELLYLQRVTEWFLINTETNTYPAGRVSFHLAVFRYVVYNPQFMTLLSSEHTFCTSHNFLPLSCRFSYLWSSVAIIQNSRCQNASSAVRYMAKIIHIVKATLTNFIIILWDNISLIIPHLWEKV